MWKCPVGMEGRLAPSPAGESDCGGAERTGRQLGARPPPSLPDTPALCERGPTCLSPLADPRKTCWFQAVSCVSKQDSLAPYRQALVLNRTLRSLLCAPMSGFLPHPHPFPPFSSRRSWSGWPGLWCPALPFHSGVIQAPIQKHFDPRSGLLPYLLTQSLE